MDCAVAEAGLDGDVCWIGLGVLGVVIGAGGVLMVGAGIAVCAMVGVLVVGETQLKLLKIQP